MLLKNITISINTSKEQRIGYSTKLKRVVQYCSKHTDVHFSELSLSLVSVRTDGEMNTPSVNVQNRLVKQAVSVIART